MQEEFKGLTQSDKILRNRTADLIQIDNIEQVKDLETEDRYKVLEFLVKEMMIIK